MHSGWLARLAFVACVTAFPTWALADGDPFQDPVYVRLHRQIDTAIHGGSLPELEVEARSFARAIDRTGFDDYRKLLLRSRLMEAVVSHAHVDDADAVYEAFLRGDSELASIAVDAAADAESVSDRLASALVTVALDGRASDELREGAVHALRATRRPEWVEAVEAIARAHDDSRVPHTVARWLVEEREEHEGALDYTLESEGRALREEAAAALAYGESHRDVVVQILSEVALDDCESDVARDHAVWALGVIDDPRAHATLLSMLEPQHWFCCVELRGLKMDALAAVIEGIDQHLQAEDRGALEMLAKRLASAGNDDPLIGDRLRSALEHLSPQAGEEE